MQLNRRFLLFGLIVAALSLVPAGIGAQDEESADGESEAPPRGDPAAYTQWVVHQAIERYDAEGRDATLERYNSPESSDGQWYVFIVDADGTLIANASRPDLVGTSTADRRDLFGKPYGLEIVAATAEGRWVDYYITHPETRRLEQKHSWVVAHDGLFFASGWYEVDESDAPPKAVGRAYARHLVAEAIHRYDTEGRDATLAYLNSPESLDGEWYVFALDSDGIAVANANRPDIVGTDRTQSVDSTGNVYGPALVAAPAEGHWVDYLFTHPETGEDAPKHTWVVRHDGLILGAGWHPSGEVPAQSDVATYTQHLVVEAIERYEADGRDAVIEFYNDPGTVDGQWYVFIDHPDGTILSHPANPDLVGTDLSGYTDVNGKLFGPEILAAGTDGRWVDYYFTDPSDGVDRQKYSWVIRYDDLLFGSGWYQVPEPADADMTADSAADESMGEADTTDGEMGEADMGDTADAPTEVPPSETGPPEDISTG